MACGFRLFPSVDESAKPNEARNHVERHPKNSFVEACAGKVARGKEQDVYAKVRGNAREEISSERQVLEL